ncbi:mechanosensitive ion channel family protein [uncultured Tateyamaria sp.]|uniref:mechanosensitive ion channel family protein n=1 Tax=Tateyamaria sp. 1078 TaxID=3417464 RepID=UPI00261C5710|nr:mechanosensitive ion channel family protein [uncultured Tateyamaria sp.]
MIRAFCLVLFLCLPLGLAAQTADQPSGTIAVEDSATQDAAIAVRIRDILGELEGYEEVTVTVSSGIVTLRGTTVDAATAERLNELVGRVAGVVAIENEVAETTDVVARLNPAVDRFMARMQQMVALLPLATVALLAFVLVTALGVVIARLRYPWDRIAPNAFIADIYRQVIRILFLVGGVVIALDILGATALLGTILGAAGIVGLAIGFAVRDTVENFIASIMLSIRQPFRPNDTIEIEGDIGKVIRLTSRATILLSFDGNHIRIPNATVFKSRIVNYTRNDERRFLIDLGVAYDTDLARAQALALDTVRALPFVLDAPEPSVWIEELGDSAVIIKVAAWIAQHETSFLKARSEAWRLCIAAFDAEGIVMPETTLRVLGVGEVDADAPAPKPAAPAPVPEVAAQDVQATDEAALEAIVNQEREDGANEDLLNRETLREE